MSFIKRLDKQHKYFSKCAILTKKHQTYLSSVHELFVGDETNTGTTLSRRNAARSLLHILTGIGSETFYLCCLAFPISTLGQAKPAEFLEGIVGWEPPVYLHDVITSLGKPDSELFEVAGMKKQIRCDMAF